MTNYFEVNDSTIQSWRKYLENSVLLLSQCSLLTNSYLLDFFSEDLWPNINDSWKNVLENSSPVELSEFLREGKSSFANGKDAKNSVLPLSLIAFRKACSTYSLPRKAVNSPKILTDFLHKRFENKDELQCPSWPNNDSDSIWWRDSSLSPVKEREHHKLLSHVFRVHLKPKKQHEVARLALIINHTKSITETHVNADIGSGCGHLARLLSYGYNNKVVCVDKEEDFVNGARKFDKQLEKSIRKRRSNFPSEGPKHSSCLLDPHSSTDYFSKEILSKWSNEEADGPSPSSFGLSGLHACGDLTPTILKCFVSTKECRYICSVSCCYMKLTTQQEQTENPGFPMSNHLSTDCKETSFQMSYTARELSCHAIDSYCERLCHEMDKLKVHCYRAALEKIVVRHYPHHRRAGMKSVKNAHTLPFDVYAREAVSLLDGGGLRDEDGPLDGGSLREGGGLKLPSQELISIDVDQMLSRWYQVVIFYILRVIVAPVIECVILLDRAIYLHEQGIDSILVPIFDPLLSPRNVILLAVKKGKKKDEISCITNGL